MTFAEVEARARAAHLDVFGALDCTGDPALDQSARRLLLLGPHEPGFWAAVTGAPEFRDGAPDPLDRWSRREISALAEDCGGTAHFPFGGPPFAPFQRWAEESGRCWLSPVGLLVHDRAGLWVSFRGAIALPFALDLPAPARKPCDTCEGKPCLAACPVGALNAEGYDLAGRHAFLDGPGRQSCMRQGCDVRRSCPAGARYGRLDAQSAYHMERFHR